MFQAPQRDGVLYGGHRLPRHAGDDGRHSRLSSFAHQVTEDVPFYHLRCYRPARASGDIPDAKGRRTGSWRRRVLGRSPDLQDGYTGGKTTDDVTF